MPFENLTLAIELWHHKAKLFDTQGKRSSLRNISQLLEPLRGETNRDLDKQVLLCKLSELPTGQAL